MISAKELEQMRDQDIETVSVRRLKSLADVKIKTDAPQDEKVLSFIEQIGNPYCFMSGEIAVCLRFSGNGKKIDQELIDIFSIMRQM